MMSKILLYNGEVVTVNAKDEIAQAVLIEGNRIRFVGSNEEAFRLCGESTQKIDVQGNTVLPGFIETHIHTASRVVLTKGIDLSKKSGIVNIEALQKRIRENTEPLKEGEWLICHGLTFEDLEERRWPTRWELDSVSQGHPVAITHSSGHTGLYNTKAFELCHVLDGEIGYPDEHVVKDENGVPNGVMKEVGHFQIQNVIDQFNPVTEEKIIDTLAEASKLMSSVGITTAHDAGATGTLTVRAMQKGIKAGKINCRMYPMLFTIMGKDLNIKFINAQLQSGFITGFGDEYMKIGPVKIMIDGSGASGTCATRRPMSHNNKMMPPSMTQEEVDDIVVRAHKAGFQITAHCIGDKGVEMVLDAYEKAQREFPRENCRHRIEHCMIAEPDLLERIRRLKVIPTFNPAFINLWGVSFNKYYQGSRQNYLIPMRSAIDGGIVCTAASDWECIPDIRPIQGIASAIDRTVYANGEKVAENQAISLMEAIRCYTYNGAYASFDEDRKGSLEAGKLADIVILDGKITEKTPFEISKMSVTKTIFDGKIVYEK
jgi:predicted amidohydrolase YtcJ